jgi:hypothetical protein
MESNPQREFGTPSKSLPRKPLGVIALLSERVPIVDFLVIFPIPVLDVSTWDAFCYGSPRCTGYRHAGNW